MNFKPVNSDTLYEGYDEWVLEKAIRTYSETHDITTTLDIISKILVTVYNESCDKDRKEKKI